VQSGGRNIFNHRHLIAERKGVQLQTIGNFSFTIVALFSKWTGTVIRTERSIKLDFFVCISRQFNAVNFINSGNLSQSV